MVIVSKDNLGTQSTQLKIFAFTDTTEQ